MEARIPSLLDRSTSLENQAKQAFNIRNGIRTFARELMADRNAASELYKNSPNLTWEQTVEKYSQRGLSGDDLYQEIINASQRSNTGVNQRLGVTPKSNSE